MIEHEIDPCELEKACPIVGIVDRNTRDSLDDRRSNTPAEHSQSKT